MTCIPRLTDTQRRLVEDHLYVAHQVIHDRIVVNEQVYGFEYDDLFQEGCIWLCKAAVHYRPEKEVQFSTFAKKVITNGLKTYCRLMCNKQKRLVSLPNYADPSEQILSMDQFSSGLDRDQFESELDVFLLLQNLKRQYTGTTRWGIEAIEWKVKGYTGVQIAAMYGVKPNHVGAWISRAVRKIARNRMFILWMDQYRSKEII
jgi:RNA polymerase sigma factor (sigma-70 family)